MPFNELNPKIAPFYKNLKVPTSAASWPKLVPGQPRRVSVNSFGFGGTNAHAVIESYRPPPITPSKGPLFTPLVISAATEKSLRALMSSYSEYLKMNPHVSLRDFAYTIQERRSTLAYRASLPYDVRPQWTLRQELLADAASSRITEAAISQPLCTAIQILLVELLQLTGIKLSAVVGHSSGKQHLWARLLTILVQDFTKFALV
jgi:acyl transferase domain-containing protein